MTDVLRLRRHPQLLKMHGCRFLWQIPAMDLLSLFDHLPHVHQQMFQRRCIQRPMIEFTVDPVIQTVLDAHLQLRIQLSKGHDDDKAQGLFLHQPGDVAACRDQRHLLSLL